MEEIRQEPEELDRCLPVDFSALLACRELFVEEIRQKRRLRPRKKGLRSKRKSLRPKKKGSVLLGKFGLPSWLFAEADDDPLATRGATTDLFDSNYEEDEEEDKNGDKKDVLPSCPVQKCDIETVDVIAKSRWDTLGSLMLESHEEYLSVMGTGSICSFPLLALANITRSCILTRTCYHCRYRTDDITKTDVSHRELEPENMIQVSSLTLPKTYPHSGSSLPLCSPCRGIYALALALLDVDLKIKHEGDDESADEEFIAGYFELVTNCDFDFRFRYRLHDGIHSSHFLDIDYRYIGWSIAATVIASANV